MRALAFATVVALLVSGPALADGPIATAAVAGPAAPQPTAAAPPLGAPAAVSDEGPQMAMGPCGPEKVKADGSLETKPHGEVDVGVGTSGYRHVGGAVCQPIGKDGVVAFSASETQGQFGFRRH